MVGKLGSDLGNHHVIGMPGCARSPKLNGLDWVLQLVLADIPLQRGELAEMAAGGLLMEIASRPMPRAPPVIRTLRIVSPIVHGSLMQTAPAARRKRGPLV